MPEGYDVLTEKEKETLRLVVRGHDAKSLARELSLSVHTINERLRVARRKLSVTSSREAARLVFEHEKPAYENSAYKNLGEAFSDEGAAEPVSPASCRQAGLGRAFFVAGAIVMLSILAALALFSQSANQPSDEPPQEIASSDRAVDQAARAWLAVVDLGDWSASFEAAGKAFRDMNTLEGWSEASEEVRAPLGTVASRELVESKFLNAPPRGYRSVTFRTTYSVAGEVMEEVTLEREESGWRVVGYIIE